MRPSSINICLYMLKLSLKKLAWLLSRQDTKLGRCTPFVQHSSPHVLENFLT